MQYIYKYKSQYIYHYIEKWINALCKKLRMNSEFLFFVI